MSSKQLQLFAVVTAIAALLFAFLAYYTAPDSPPPATAQPSEGTAGWPKAVVALAPLPMGKPIAAEAVKLVPVAVAPEAGYTRLEDVVGRVPVTPVGVGEPLTTRHFTEGSVLARKLAEGERAVAVAVDEVVGVGGQLAPGDWVDVLAYLRADGRQLRQSQAQVLLQRVRVLSAADDLHQRKRTVVLAVPAEEAPRLMLADSAGQLRLVLQSAQAQPSAEAPAALLSSLDRAPAPRVIAARRKESITIYRADQKTRINQ